MKIDMGNFGFKYAEPAPRVKIPAGAFDTGGDVLARAGDKAIQIAENMIEKERQQDERVNAMNGLAAVENGLADLHDEVNRGLSDGSIERDKAVETFKSRSRGIISESLNGLDPKMQEIIKASSQRTLGRLQNSVGDAVFKRRQQDSMASLNNFLVANQRLSLDDREIATKRSLDAIEGTGPSAGLNPVQIGQLRQKTLEGIADVHATRLVSGARNSIGAIEQALTALDGKDFTDLDPKRREVLRSALETTRYRLESRADNLLLRAEAKGERAIAQADQQISSGVPATQEQWAKWEIDTRGTSSQDAFSDRVRAERDVQKLLRAPLEQQAAFVQEREADLMQNGGTLRDRANLDRLKRVVEIGRKQLEDAPLLFAQNRTGEAVKPLDLSALTDTQRSGELSAQLSERVATLDALRQQYGPQVRTKPLLPHEALSLTKMLDQSSPRQQLSLLSAMRNAIGDDATYSAAVAQVVPDAPVKALAGMMMAKERKITLESNWVRDDVMAASGDVAETMLSGESLINKANGQKGEDGKPLRSLYIPPLQDFQTEFAKYAGTAFAGRPDALSIAQQAAYAYYVGKSAKTGRLNTDVKDIDSSLLKESLTATLGTPVDYGSGGTVFAPWGMAKSTFKDKVHQSFSDTIKARGMPETVVDQLPSLGLRQLGEDTYYVTQGRNFLFDKNNQPIIIQVQP